MVLSKLLDELESLDSARELLAELSRPSGPVTVTGLAGSAKAMIGAFAARRIQRTVLFVTADIDEAEAAAEDLKSFLGEEAVLVFPSWGIAPYEIRAPHSDIIGQRLLTLYSIGKLSQRSDWPRVIVAPVQALAEPTIPKYLLTQNSLHLRRGQQFERDDLIRLLERLNYRRTPMAEMLGEYSVRGGIIDLFSPTAEDPIRLEFFGDEIDSIRNFSVLTQRSTKQIDSVFILPRREILFDGAAIENYAHRLSETSAQALHSTLGNGDYDGLEFIWPNLKLEMSDLFEHLPGDTLVAIADPQTCREEGGAVFERAKEKHEAVKDVPVAEPERVYLTPEKLAARLHNFQTLNLLAASSADEAALNFHVVPQEYFGTNVAYLKKRLSELHHEGYQLNILCEGPGQKERIGEIIEGMGVPVELHVARLSSGFAVAQLRKWFFADHQIFTRHKKRRTFRRFHEGVALSSYTRLNPGDFVVHIDYGIGKYQGLETLVVDGRKRDCLSLLYLGDDRLYVPVEEFNRVQKYAGKEGAPRLSKLGTGTWERVKARTRKALMSMAAELVNLYAERQAFPGFAHKPDSDWMRQLETSFEYAETPDQLRAMDEIKLDMEKPVPTDRLICGDVGYGKTELAIRAALKAVDSGKQVAVLAPTTILAAQHLATFSERLAAFPVKIEMLSRFRTSAESKAVKRGLEDGTIDIVIGTHKLLQKDVKFKDLGLLVIDEEQRFGVAHKEKIKKLRSQIDVLTLTATPIPRTLQMSLAGVRDMSIINTPPRDRLPITTEVSRFADRVIVDAVNRELDRDGQVFIVHNRVQTIYGFYSYLKRILPLVNIGVAHGQMPERELERVMRDFLDRKHQVLLSTTIIESGLDIPSVNTIIINRADKLGLAQLYQLRGRVGRSRYRAYAHLLIPPLTMLTRDARKRLKAIEEFTELGSGFHLAMRDLEIRGAGNLLGAQQHGFIEEVGFDLYMRLLEEAVAQLKGKVFEEYAAEVKVTTDLDQFLPENYIPDSDQRVEIYRKFSDVKTTDDITDIMLELEDRFGPPPEAAASLAQVAAMRILARALGLQSVQLKGNALSLEFAEKREITRDNIESWVKNVPEKMEFKYDRNFRIHITLQDGNDEAQEAKNVLQKMAG